MKEVNKLTLELEVLRRKNQPVDHPQMTDAKNHVMEYIQTILEEKPEHTFNIQGILMTGGFASDIIRELGNSVKNFRMNINLILANPYCRQRIMRAALEQEGNSPVEAGFSQIADHDCRKAKELLNVLTECRKINIADARPENCVRWFDGIPTYFYFKVDEHVLFQPYLNTVKGADWFAFTCGSVKSVSIDGHNGPNIAEIIEEELDKDFNSLWEISRSIKIPDKKLPRIISFDLDGTLVQDYHKKTSFEYLDLLEGFLRMLKFHQRKLDNHEKIIVVISTGRGKGFVDGILAGRFGGLIDWYVLENGCILSKELKETDNELRDNFSFGVEKTIRDLQCLRNYMFSIGISYEPGKEIGITFNRNTNGVEQNKKEILQLMTLIDEDIPTNVLDNPGLEFSSDSCIGYETGKIDIGLPEMNKLTGMESLIEVLNRSVEGNNAYTLNDVLHFGDSANDAELLRECGWAGVISRSEGEFKFDKALEEVNSHRRQGEVRDSNISKFTHSRGVFDILLDVYGLFFMSSGFSSSVDNKDF